ncbi:Uncharacterized protein FWK35_00030309, partial [Aphis craccivora]
SKYSPNSLNVDGNDETACFKHQIFGSWPRHHGYEILDSERSYDFIDFTMMCVFFRFVFVSMYSITCRNNASISNFGGGFRCKSEYPWCIIAL